MFCRPLSCQRDALCNALCFQRWWCTVVRCLLGNKRHFWEQLNRWIETAQKIFSGNNRIVVNILTLTTLFHILVKFIETMMKVVLTPNLRWNTVDQLSEEPSAMNSQNYVSISVNLTVCFQCLAIPPQVLPVALPVTKAPSRQVSQEVRVAPCLLWPLLVLEMATTKSLSSKVSHLKIVTTYHHHGWFTVVFQQPIGSSENESLSPFPDKLRSLVGHFSPTFSKGSRALTPRWEAAGRLGDGGWWLMKLEVWWLTSEWHTHTHTW